MPEFHGMRETPTYSSWINMKKRCFNKEHAAYPRYGGRGITVCERWKTSFMAFLSDLGERPEGTTLGRIDNNGDYEPGNCRWETKEEQSINLPHGKCSICGSLEHDIRLHHLTPAERADRRMRNYK